MTPVDNLLAKLQNVKKSASGWTARCPAHDDRQPSLSIAEGDDGRALVKCHAGCTVDSICSSIGLSVSDLMRERPYTPSTSTQSSQTRGKRQFRRQGNGKPKGKAYSTDSNAVAALDAITAKEQGRRVSQWTYHDVHGNPVAVIVRYDLPTPEGEKQAKTFRPVARNGEQWIVGGMQEPRLLYRLPDLARADRVYIVEGEKCVELARSIGLNATTSAHGAKSASKTDWSPLAGKECVVIPDFGAAGSRYAEEVVAIVGKLANTVVKVIELPGLKNDGDDIEQFIIARREAGLPDEQVCAEIEALADQAEAIQPDQPAARIERFKPFPTDALPEPIRRFVEAGAKAIGCDPSYIALPMLTALAAGNRAYSTIAIETDVDMFHRIVGCCDWRKRRQEESPDGTRHATV